MLAGIDEIRKSISAFLLKMASDLSDPNLLLVPPVTMSALHNLSIAHVFIPRNYSTAQVQPEQL
jgi:hypothetical protein